jgi:hypothetical protein
MVSMEIWRRKNSYFFSVNKSGARGSGEKG